MLDTQGRGERERGRERQTHLEHALRGANKKVGLFAVLVLLHVEFIPLESAISDRQRERERERESE